MGDIADTVAMSLRGHGLEVVAVPFPQNTFRDEQGYRRELTKALLRYRPELVLPVGHLLAAARLAHRGEDDEALAPALVRSAAPGLTPALAEALQGVAIPVDTPANIQLLDSKVRCSALATQLNIPQPQLFATPAEAADCPVIFKRDSSFGGSGVYRPATPEALTRLVEHEGTRPYLIEAYVEGWDCSIDVLRWGDRFEAACYRTLSRKQGQGPSAFREPCQRPDVVAYARRLLDAVDYQGVCGMDFRISATADTSLFLECNPRLTGGLATHLAAGFNLPLLWLKASLDTN